MLIVIWLILHLFLFIDSSLKVRRSQGKVSFIYFWATPSGSFVWEDLVIFSLFNIFISSLALFMNDYRIFVLFWLVFWIIRGAGEAIYFFLQQFIRPNFPPHNIARQFNQFKLLGNLTDQQGFIFLQIIWQMVTVVAASFLILFLLNWSSFPWQRIY